MYQVNDLPSSANALRVDDFQTSLRFSSINTRGLYAFLLAFLSVCFPFQESFGQLSSSSSSVSVEAGVPAFHACGECGPTDPQTNSAPCSTVYNPEKIAFSLTSLVPGGAILNNLVVEVHGPLGQIAANVTSSFNNITLVQHSQTSQAPPKDYTYSFTNPNNTLIWYYSSNPFSLPYTLNYNYEDEFAAIITYELCDANSNGTIPPGTYYVKIIASGTDITSGDPFEAIFMLTHTIYPSSAKLSSPSDSESSLKWVPNPSSNRAILSFELSEESPVDMTIYNTLGQVALQGMVGKTLPAGKHAIKLDVSALPLGIYYTKIQTLHGPELIKWVKTD